MIQLFCVILSNFAKYLMNRKKSLMNRKNLTIILVKLVLKSAPRYLIFQHIELAVTIVMTTKYYIISIVNILH